MHILISCHSVFVLVEYNLSLTVTIQIVSNGICAPRKIYDCGIGLVSPEPPPELSLSVSCKSLQI